jgi:hypothetical protein
MRRAVYGKGSEGLRGTYVSTYLVGDLLTGVVGVTVSVTAVGRVSARKRKYILHDMT